MGVGVAEETRAVRMREAKDQIRFLSQFSCSQY